jgi:hypothetical protein
METQTRFDLNAAIADWQQEMVAQPDLTPIVRRELETHLRDTIAELQARGLNNEEAFWLARRRTGMPQQIGEEFAKADPVRVWRDRAFWMAAVLLAQNSWLTFWSNLWDNRIYPHSNLADILPVWIEFYLPNWLRMLPVFTICKDLFLAARFAPIVIIALLIGTRRLNFAKSALSFLTASRLRFIVAALAFFGISNFFTFFRPTSTISWIFWNELPWIGSLIAVGAWLIPPKKETAVKAA